MTLSDLIKELQELAKTAGDPVVVSFNYQFPGYSKVYAPPPLEELTLENEIAVSDQREREKICQQCPKYSVFKVPVLDKLVGQCLECGCVIAWKTRIKSSHCPIGKW